MTLSTAPLSLGKMGLANGGPGGCMPAKTTNAHIKSRAKTNAWQPSWACQGTYLHLALVSRGSWASSPAGQRREVRISLEVLLELREEHVLSGQQQWTTFYLHNPVSPDSSPLWDWYVVLTLLVWVCYLTQKCVSWSQRGSSSRSHINWGSHWHGSQSHPSLSDLCIDCIVLLLPSFLQMFFLNAHWCAVPCPGLGVIWGRTGVASSSYSRTSIAFKTKQFQKI